MSHRKLITKITPADTNRRLKSEAVNGHYDQAQLARLADVNNLGEQSDKILQGAVSNYDFTDEQFYLHETSETGVLSEGPGDPIKLKGYYLVCVGGFEDVLVNQELVRITIASALYPGGIFNTGLTGSLNTYDNTNDVAISSAFANGALAWDTVDDLLVPLSRCGLSFSSDDPANPGNQLEELQRVYLNAESTGGVNEVAFDFFFRLNFLVPEDATVSIVAR